MSRAKIERETVIIFNEEEDTARVWSASPKMINKLQKLGFKGESRGTVESKFFELPKKSVSLRKVRTSKNIMSKEALAKCKERMKKINSAS